MLKKFLIVFVALASIAGFWGVLTAFDSSSNKSPSMLVGTVTQPASLLGNWHQVKSGIPDAKMAANITDDKIVISLTMGDTTGTFWAGTFDTSKNGSQSFTITSVGDRNALAGSMYASSEKTKWFKYSDGDLSFQFSIMGVSTIVHLSK